MEFRSNSSVRRTQFNEMSVGLCVSLSCSMVGAAMGKEKKRERN